MTAVVIEETGEVVEMMTAVEAERITARIADKLDSIADNLEQVLPLIGEALTREAWRALGYNSPQSYVSERFAGALTRLPLGVRQPVVRQLSEAGMSTRAIAPVVGVKSDQTVRADLRIAQVRDDHAPADEVSPLPKSPTVTGLDGKTYQRPETPREPVKQKRRPLTDRAVEAAMDLEDMLDALIRITEDDRFPSNSQALRDRLKVNRPQLWDQKIQRICDAYGLNRSAEMKEATHAG